MSYAYGYLPSYYSGSGNLSFNPSQVFTTWTGVSYNSLPTGAKSNIALWSQDPVLGITPEKLAEAAKKAAEKGDTVWAKIINNVLFYGDKVLEILVNRGIIKNKNSASSLLDGTFEKALAQKLLDDNGGDLNPNTVRTNSAPEVFGIPVSTLIVVVVLVVLWSMFKNDLMPSKGKSKK